VVIAAIANKLARTIWAVLATGKRYDGASFAAALWATRNQNTV
jgi:hypothetical protein